MTIKNIVVPQQKCDAHDFMQRHTWVLFVLADMSRYFEESGLPQVAATLEESILAVERGILSQSTVPAPLQGATDQEAETPSEDARIIDFPSATKKSAET